MIWKGGGGGGSSVRGGATHSSDSVPPLLTPSPADFEGTSASLGKPALNDVKQGLATAPVLFAAHRFPSLLPLIERKFSSPGDIDAAVTAVSAADGVALTRKLAVAHAQMALSSIHSLSESPAKTALAALASRVLNRTR